VDISGLLRTVPGVTRRPEWLPSLDTTSSANDVPVDLAELSRPREVVRAFAFLDLSGFTRFTDEVGPAASHMVLVSFRQLVRDVAAWRGMRIAKWLGDGVLLIGVTAPPLVACAVDIVARVYTEALDVRAGVSVGPALMIDGEDYVGRAVNLASRLCDLAEPGQVLADRDSRFNLPDWIVSEPYPTVDVRSIGVRDDLSMLRPAPGVGIVRWQLPA